MKTVWTLAWRDFRSYFTSPIAYIVIAVFLVIMGWMFFGNLYHFAQQAMQYRREVSLMDGIVRPVYGNMNVIFLFLAPFITMRLFAEEKRDHTFELLMTSPVTLTQVIAAKFLSSFLFVLIMLTLTLVYPVILFLTGNPEIGPIITSLLGTVLVFSCYLAMGILCSAVTENQIVAGALTFGFGLFFWLISWASNFAGPVWSEIINYLSIIGHYNNFSRGIIQTTDVIFYFSFVGLWLFLAHRFLDSYRWR